MELHTLSKCAGPWVERGARFPWPIVNPDLMAWAGSSSVPGLVTAPASAGRQSITLQPTEKGGKAFTFTFSRDAAMRDTAIHELVQHQMAYKHRLNYPDGSGPMAERNQSLNEMGALALHKYLFPNDFPAGLDLSKYQYVALGAVATYTEAVNHTSEILAKYGVAWPPRP